MSISFKIVISLACLSQVEDREIFRSGDIFVRRMTHMDEKGEVFTRNTLFVDRTNFGTNVLTDSADDPLRRKPTTYYHRDGPVGLLFRTVDLFPENGYASDALPPAKLVGCVAVNPLAALSVPWSEPAIGVVGMHSGTIASYVKPFQTIHFLERNPVIVKLSHPEAQAKRYFHNIADSERRGGQVKIIPGDARPSIEKAPKGFYKFLFVEMSQRTYLEDVEVELITQEGIQACVDTLTPDGVVCFHTSSRHLNLSPVVTNSAISLNLASQIGYDPGRRAGEFRDDHYSSEWVFVSRKAIWLNELAASPNRGKLHFRTGIDPHYMHVWTDKGRNPLKGVLRDDPVLRHINDTFRNWFARNFPWLWSERVASVWHEMSWPLIQLSREWLEWQNVSSAWLRKTN